MNFIIFPIILIYFMIGWLLSKGSDDLYDEAESITYFLFWPAIAIWCIGFYISSVLLFVIRKLFIITRNIHRLIKRSIHEKRRIDA